MLISVIIPVYNGEKYLQECLLSVKACPSQEIECIIVNDGSTDDTEQICRKIAKDDSRFKLINQENSGVSVSRNKGTLEAIGEYIFFLDADDYIDTEKWQDILDYAKGKHDMVAFGYYNLFTSGSTSVEQFPLNCSTLDVLLSTTLFNTCWGKLLRRDIISQSKLSFTKELKTCEDAIFMIDFIQNSTEHVLCNTPVLFYRIHPNSVMQSTKLENKIADLTQLYMRRKDCLAANYTNTAEITMYRQFFSIITDLFRTYAKIHNIPKTRETYKKIITNTLVSAVVTGTKRAYLPLYKKLEHILLSGGHYSCLALYFKIKGRF